MSISHLSATDAQQSADHLPDDVLSPVEGMTTKDRVLVHMAFQLIPEGLDVRTNNLVDKTPIMQTFATEQQLLVHLSNLQAQGLNKQGIRAELIRRLVEVSMDRLSALVKASPAETNATPSSAQ